MKRKIEISKNRLIVLIAVLLASAITINIMLEWASSPAVQSFDSSSDTPRNTTEDITVSTSYFRTKVPGTYHVQTAENSDTTMVQITAFQSNNMNTQIGITSKSLPESGLTEIADYNYRIKRTDLYESFSIENMPAGSAAFRTYNNSGSSESTIFLLTNGRYASISISSTSETTGTLTKIGEKVVNHWVWL